MRTTSPRVAPGLVVIAPRAMRDVMKKTNTIQGEYPFWIPLVFLNEPRFVFYYVVGRMSTVS